MGNLFSCFGPVPTLSAVPGEQFGAWVLARDTSVMDTGRGEDVTLHSQGCFSNHYTTRVTPASDNRFKLEDGRQ